MTYRTREKRLRELAAQLESLPRTRERDDLLWAVRGRFVRLETGFDPSGRARQPYDRERQPYDRERLSPAVIRSAVDRGCR